MKGVRHRAHAAGSGNCRGGNKMPRANSCLTSTMQVQSYLLNMVLTSTRQVQ